jgi:hypothetical protein
MLSRNSSEISRCLTHWTMCVRDGPSNRTDGSKLWSPSPIRHCHLRWYGVFHCRIEGGISNGNLESACKETTGYPSIAMGGPICGGERARDGGTLCIAVCGFHLMSLCSTASVYRQRSNKEQSHRSGAAERLLHSATCSRVSQGATVQPTTEPSKCDVLHDSRVLWQSPRSGKSL